MLGRATLGATLSILLVSTDHLIVEVRPAHRDSELGLTGIEKSRFRQNRGEATDHGLKAAHAPHSKQAMIVARGTGAKHRAPNLKRTLHPTSAVVNQSTSTPHSLPFSPSKDGRCVSCSRIVPWRIKGGGTASRDIELERSELQLPKIRSLVLLGTWLYRKSGLDKNICEENRLFKTVSVTSATRD